ncbi:potassium-transporting ATPase subunit KdpC [Roseomonas eburnea]|uniref:Potassium-transporting ATPase KdpC subunit n=1 Tax=Neoroseomonas eburnea TaxID=1346889 RepID=A0A9X9XH59_9PROT|nr:potassium-transporting ATPase subunit KdpC [Neoroseomonas eburnea]MBR0683045.1 potassium-transporting ATPase subunit KdpC [Neoroseomonas eburnea]
MTALLRPAFAVVGLFTLLLGLAVPLAFTGVAGLVFPGEAGGSLVERQGRMVGSMLLGQNFTSERYFHPRPSATSPDPYNAAAGAASQLGPTSAALGEAVTERVAAAGGGTVPADAVTASGSGLDPHISPANAARQVPRIAAARGLPEARVAELVARHTEGRQFGLLGEPRVNVLRLNLALDALR